MYLFLYGMACRVRYASYSCNLTWFLVSKILCFIRLPLSKFQVQPGIRPTGLGGLVYRVAGQAAVRQKRRVGVVAAQVGAHQRRVCIGVAVFAQMAAGVIGADVYLLLVRWKGSSLSIERSTGPFFQIFSLCSKFGHSCSNPYNSKHNKKP